MIDLLPPLLLAEFKVIGRPAPQGSKRGFVNKSTGRVVMVEQSKYVKPWRDIVVSACIDPRRPAFDGPLRLRMVFTMAKPASKPKHLKTYPDVAPDISKLCRAVEDAMTDAGVYRDDSQIVEYDRLAKVYPLEDPDALHVPGVIVRIWSLR